MNKGKISKILFYIPYIMWLCVFILHQSYYKDLINIDVIFQSIRILTYISLLLKLLFDNEYYIKSIFIFIFIILICFICRNTENYFLFDTILFIYSARNINIKSLIKVTLIVQVSLMVLIIMSSLLGVIPNDLIYSNSRKVRHGLGFRYTTFSSNFYFNIVLMFLYSKQGKEINNISRLIILGINYFIYVLTDTKSVFILVCIGVIIEYIINFSDKPIKNSIYNKLAFKYSFLICAIISIFITINYNSSSVIYSKIDNILSNRLRLGYNAYQEYGISILGRKIIWSTSPGVDDLWGRSLYNYVDSAYVQILLNYGIILLLFICCGYIIIGKYAIANNQKNICLVLLLLALHSITDPQLIDLRYNTFLFMFSMFCNPFLVNSIKYNFNNTILQYY